MTCVNQPHTCSCRGCFPHVTGNGLAFCGENGDGSVGGDGSISNVFCTNTRCNLHLLNRMYGYG
eukprot:m.1280483 g.1280483  ORF g.1280483 m.1280483 type:complete len:64 (+) comp24769_c0_seq4:1787-1978(+)